MVVVAYTVVAVPVFRVVVVVVAASLNMLAVVVAATGTKFVVATFTPVAFPTGSNVYVLGAVGPSTLVRRPAMSYTYDVAPPSAAPPSSVIFVTKPRASR